MTQRSTDPTKEGWVNFAIMGGFIPRLSITLTFDPKRVTAGNRVSRDGAIWWWRRLVQVLNESALQSRDYQRKVGHSYFGYVMGVEHHKSGAVHVHAVVDNWVDCRRIHDWWNEYCGYAWTKALDGGNTIQALEYVLKYVVKSDSRPTFFFQKRRREVRRVELGGGAPEATPVRPEAVKAGAFRRPKGGAGTGASLDSEGDGLGWEQCRLPIVPPGVD
jgi:hypothetical protein